VNSLIHKFWQVISGSQADTEKAIEAAAEAFKTFSRTTLEQVSGVCTGATSGAYVGLFQLFAGTF
jgi:acyl-CoA reductase-like NAD-dependent aldehyde dehydrogenase